MDRGSILVWIHNGATKIGRGELFEAVECLSFLRSNVLGPLALSQAGARPCGVRRIEELAREFAEPLQGTVPAYDKSDCIRALRTCADLYRSLRPDRKRIELRQDAEIAALHYLTELAAR